MITLTGIYQINHKKMGLSVGRRIKYGQKLFLYIGWQFTLITGIILWLPTALFCQNAIVNILDFGAKGDGTTLNTVAIQAAINACASQGGGQVIVPSGVYLTGSIRLKDHIELRLQQGSVLLGSTRRDAYDKNKWYALVLAQGLRYIAITGDGTIDGQGTALAQNVDSLYHLGLLEGGYKDNRPHESQRPQLIDFEQCTHVKITGVLLKNSACWVQRYGRCDSLTIDGIRVESRAFWNNDGIDLADCSHTLVQNCTINAADDGICLKSDAKDRCCNDILIRNCTIRSSASAVKFGTNSYGGFKRIKVENLQIYDTFRSAIALEIVDGGTLEDVEISHITAQNTGNALFLRLGHRNQRVPPGAFRNVYIHDLNVRVPRGKPDYGYPLEGPPIKEPHNLIPASIVGIPGHNIENVVLENIRIHYEGGGDCTVACMLPDRASTVPEREKDYPEFSMFGELPAWGFYFRHVDGLILKKVTLALENKDYRPPYVFEDVKRWTSKRVRPRP